MKTYKNHLNEEIKRPKYPKGKWVKKKITDAITMEDYYFGLDVVVVAIDDFGDTIYKTLTDWQLDFNGNTISETAEVVVAFMVLKPYK